MEERREGGREGGIEGGTFIHTQYIYIHTPTYIVHMHTLICTLTAAASWQVRLFQHALADLVTVDTQWDGEVCHDRAVVLVSNSSPPLLDNNLCPV